MRSMRMLAAVTGILALVTACGGDGGGIEPDSPPVASFAAPSAPPCTAGTACTFTDASTDDNAVTGWDWDFGDNTTHGTTEDVAHTYTAAGSYNAVLIVSDAAGLKDTATVAVTVGAAGNTPPTAGFTYNCNAGNCVFTNTSADTDADIASYAWEFGEPSSGAANQSNLKDPTHNYTVTGPTDFTVKLTVVDDDGATDVETQTVRVSQDLVCTGGDCTIVLTSASKVTITVDASDCQFIGNKFDIVQPIQESVFTDGCTLADGTIFTINGGAAFPAGTSLQAKFTQGTKPRPADPDPGPASTRVSGVFPEWKIEFDDGGNAGVVGEPDFNDIVLIVTATP